MDNEDVVLCTEKVGEQNLCDRIQAVADTDQDALDAATTVAITTGAIVPMLLLLPGDPSQFGYWQRVFLLGGPSIAQISGVMTVLLSGGWDLTMLYLTTYTESSRLSRVSTQLADIAAWAFWLGFLPIVFGFLIMVSVEGLWNMVAVMFKYSPPTALYDDKDVAPGVLGQIERRSDFMSSTLKLAHTIAKGTLSVRRLHTLPLFDLPPSRHVNIILCAHLAR